MFQRRVVPVWLLILLVVALAACSGGAAPTALPAAVPTAAGAPVQAQATQAPAAAQPTVADASRTLIVFAAASLTEAFDDLAQQFEAANPGVKVVANYAGSQQLSAQLTQGAPADVFASANAKEMQTAIKGSAVVSGTQKTFARNRLTVIFPKDNPAKISALADLAKPGLKIDVADKSVPVGQYTLDMLAKMSKDPAYGANFQADVLKNVVSNETDVKAVVSKVGLGEADAGVVYTTDAGSARDKLGSLAVPDQFNQIATYPIAPVAKAPQPDLAQKFVDFVLSPAGQATLARYGFITAQAAAPTPAPTGAATPGPVVLTDQGGQQVTIKQPVQRIVSAYSMATLYAYALGAGDKLVSASFLMPNDPAIKPNLARLEPDATRLVSAGGQQDTNVETVAKANPDLILTSVRAGGQDPLQTLGVPILRYQGETMAKLEEALTLTGKALGPDADARAARLVSYMQDRLAAIRAVSDRVPAAQRKRVFVSGTSPLKTAGQDMLQSEMVQLAGGTNVAQVIAGYWPEVNLEQVTKWDPEVIFVVPYKGASVEAILNSPEWADINAVKNKQVFMLPKYLGPWDTPIPEAILGIEWMAGKLFPGTPLHQGCEARVTAFYQDFYGLDVPAADATALCR
jgi:molybdate transport system substrate-binding protein